MGFILKEKFDVVYEMGETAVSSLVGENITWVKIGHSLLLEMCFTGILNHFI
jgi:hypothetical protein